MCTFCVYKRYTTPQVANNLLPGIAAVYIIGRDVEMVTPSIGKGHMQEASCHDG